MSSKSSEKTHLLPHELFHKKRRYVLVIHGGAGAIVREGSTPEQRAAYKKVLSDALLAVCLSAIFNFALRMLTVWATLGS